MTKVPAPGFAAGDLSKEGSLASWIDLSYFCKPCVEAGKGLLHPEGLLSTLPAIPTMLFGVLTGSG